jgi:copper chaperone CopZ
MYKNEFKITNLTCDACVTLSERALKEIKGVTHAQVDLKSGAVKLEGNRDIPWQEITAKLDELDKHAEKN